MSLHPIDLALVPFSIGEKVAFHEDPAFPGYSEERAGLYGVIEEIGLDEVGALKFDVALFDPGTGSLLGDEKVIYRAGMEEIQ